MDYLAFYRKYRPQVFEDVLGQNNIVLSIINQIKEGRLSHGYLFCGPRGTGKTSTAKILARALNCEHPRGHNPCNQCYTCQAILNDAFLDVIEMDAASHNGVDDIRSLIDGVKFPPSYGKKKVIIIDEAHMLSKEAFNALLKTLEEPPSYIVFVLATTEVNKLPQTIVSRLLRYDFKRIEADEMARHIKAVAKNEGLEITDSAALKIAFMADGALRDALSTLEKVASVGLKHIDDQELSDIVGAGEELSLSLFSKLMQRDALAVIELATRIYKSGKSLELVLEEITELMRKALVYAAVASKEKSGISERELNVFQEVGVVDEKFFIIDALEELLGLGKARSFSNQRAAFEYILLKIWLKEDYKARPKKCRGLGYFNDLEHEPLPVLKTIIEPDRLDGKRDLRQNYQVRPEMMSEAKVETKPDFSMESKSEMLPDNRDNINEVRQETKQETKQEIGSEQFETQIEQKTDLNLEIESELQPESQPQTLYQRAEAGADNRQEQRLEVSQEMMKELKNEVESGLRLDPELGEDFEIKLVPLPEDRVVTEPKAEGQISAQVEPNTGARLQTQPQQNLNPDQGPGTPIQNGFDAKDYADFGIDEEVLRAMESNFSLEGEAPIPEERGEAGLFGLEELMEDAKAEDFKPQPGNSDGPGITGFDPGITSSTTSFMDGGEWGRTQLSSEEEELANHLEVDGIKLGQSKVDRKIADSGTSSIKGESLSSRFAGKDPYEGLRNGFEQLKHKYITKKNGEEGEDKGSKLESLPTLDKLTRDMDASPAQAAQLQQKNPLSQLDQVAQQNQQMKLNQSLQLNQQASQTQPVKTSQVSQMPSLDLTFDFETRPKFEIRSIDELRQKWLTIQSEVKKTSAVAASILAKFSLKKYSEDEMLLELDEKFRMLEKSLKFSNLSEIIKDVVYKMDNIRPNISIAVN